MDQWQLLSEKIGAVLGTPEPGQEGHRVRLRVEPGPGGVCVSLRDEADGRVIEAPLSAAQVREFTSALGNAVGRTR